MTLSGESDSGGLRYFEYEIRVGPIGFTHADVDARAERDRLKAIVAERYRLVPHTQSKMIDVSMREVQP